MKYEAFRALADEWHVEGIDHASEGECYVTIFYGLKAQARAEEYAAWKNGAPVNGGEQ